MNIKYLLAGAVLTLLISPTVTFAQSSPPGLPAVDFGDEPVPEFQTTNETEEEDDEIGSPPSLEIDTGNNNNPEPTPPEIIVNPVPQPDPNPQPAPQPDPNPQPAPNPQPINPPVTPDTGPGLLLSLIPAIGYSLNKRFNNKQ